MNPCLSACINCPGNTLVPNTSTGIPNLIGHTYACPTHNLFAKALKPFYLKERQRRKGK